MEKGAETKYQPTTEEIKAATALLPGPLVTYRLFKAYAKRKVCGAATKKEFLTACENLVIKQVGRQHKITIPENNAKTTVFVKYSRMWFPEFGEKELELFQQLC